MANGSDIIIKGGSVNISFDEQLFPGGKGSYEARNRNVQRIQVTDESGQLKYDTDSQNVRGWMITVATNSAAESS